MAQLDKKPCPGDWEYRKGEDWKETVKRTAALMKELEDTAAAVDIEAGDVQGLLVSFGVADGSAVYVVSKAKPLTLQHVPQGDAYRIGHAHIRGLRKADILHMVEGERGLAKLFAK